MSSRSDKEAQKSALYGGLLYVPVSALFLFIGTALFSYYKVRSGLLPVDIDGDKVFPWFIVNQLPAGLTGLLIASIFAAGMSTVSTSLNSSATVILTDYFKLPPESPETEKKSMLILYISSAVFSIIAIFIAIAMINVQSALDAWWKLASIFSGGMLGLFLLGFLAPKVKNTAAIIGVIAGVVIIGWMSLSPIIFTHEEIVKYASPFHGYLSIVFGTVAIFITGFLLGNVTNKLFNTILTKCKGKQ
jgi:SSS family solute:Na+ symporter